MADPLGGDAGDPGAPTMNTENIDSAPLVGGVGGSRAPTMNDKKYRRHAHWEAMLEVSERSSSTLQKRRRWAPLGGDTGALGVPTINAENIDGGPLGGGVGDLGAPTIKAKNYRQ
jgi:hypothetical protein